VENSLTVWTVGLHSRLRAWRNLREDICALSPDDALEATYHWWKTSPAVRRTFDPWKIENWPNPWNLLYQDEQCPNSIILGVYYTLRLADINLDFCKLAIINDIEQRHNCLALIIDSETAITYNKIMSSDSADLLEVLNIFTDDDLKKLI